MSTAKSFDQRPISLFTLETKIMIACIDPSDLHHSSTSLNTMWKYTCSNSIFGH